MEMAAECLVLVLKVVVTMCSSKCLVKLAAVAAAVGDASAADVVAADVENALAAEETEMTFAEEQE